MFVCHHCYLFSGTTLTFPFTELCGPQICSRYHDENARVTFSVPTRFHQKLEVPDFLVQFGVSGDDRNWKYEALGWAVPRMLYEVPKCHRWPEHPEHPEPRPSKMMTPGEFPFW